MIYKCKLRMIPYVAMKILSVLAITFPTKVAKANREIEDLVPSDSKTISMFAVVTLLKTGTDETAKQLAAKLEPFLHKMPTSYKMMAIDTMEKLSKNTRIEFLEFIKKAFFERDRNDLTFKRYILKKFELLLKEDQCRNQIIKMLCNYIEDPEYYQLDILGILGEYLNDSKQLIHIFNRLILDNNHVKMSAIQTLYDINDRMKIGADEIFNKKVLEPSLECTKDHEINKMFNFFIENKNLKRGPFEISELGILKDEVSRNLEIEMLGS